MQGTDRHQQRGGMWSLLPRDDEARAAVQNFDVLVAEAPVDGEVAVERRGHFRADVGAAVTDHVLLHVGRWQSVLQAVVQSTVDGVKPQTLAYDPLGT